MLPYIVLLAMGLLFFLLVGVAAHVSERRDRRRRIQRLRERRRYLDQVEPQRWDVERRAA